MDVSCVSAFTCTAFIELVATTVTTTVINSSEAERPGFVKKKKYRSRMSQSETELLR